MDIALLLAQAIPNTDDLKNGDEKTILVWIIGVLLVVVAALVGYLLKTIKDHKTEILTLQDRRETDHKKMMRLALRVQKALEVWAGIEAAPTLVDDDKEDDE